jgi:uncharacterized cupin superfamily protein
MRTFSIYLCLSLLCFGTTLLAESPSLPVKMSKAEIAGSIFSERQPVVQKHDNEKGPFTTEDVEVFLSSDRHFDSGMYRSGANRFVISEAYGVDEFMYFLQGGVKLTSSNGEVLEINAGDAVTIPKEWTGVWETGGYTKIYVIYSADKEIE